MSSFSNPIILASSVVGGDVQDLPDVLGRGDTTGSASGIFFSSGDDVGLSSTSKVGWSSTSNPLGLQDVELARSSSGIMLIDDPNFTPPGKLFVSEVRYGNSTAKISGDSIGNMAIIPSAGRNLNMLSGAFGLKITSNLMSFPSTFEMSWASVGDVDGPKDISISRSASGILSIDDPNFGDGSGTLLLKELDAANSIVLNGTTISGIVTTIADIGEDANIPTELAVRNAIASTTGTAAGVFTGQIPGNEGSPASGVINIPANTLSASGDSLIWWATLFGGTGAGTATTAIYLNGNLVDSVNSTLGIGDFGIQMGIMNYLTPSSQRTVYFTPYDGIGNNHLINQAGTTAEDNTVDQVLEIRLSGTPADMQVLYITAMKVGAA